MKLVEWVTDIFIQILGVTIIKHKVMDIAKRFKENPLLFPSDIKPSIPGMEIKCLLNPGVFRYNKKTWLLLRVAERPVQKKESISFPVYNKKNKIEILTFEKHDPSLNTTDPRIIIYKGNSYLTTLSHLTLVCSDDGINFHEPAGYAPILGEGSQETFGIEDCRVATMKDGYHLTYTKVSPNAVGVGYMQTTDWKTFIRKGMIFPPHNKDCALFDEKINNKYYALHRPSSPELGGNYIWIAESPDRIHWGNHRLIAKTRKNMWDSARIGAGASPIKTEKGWLEIYHGATEKNRYCLGALLLELKHPEKVIARSREPIMEPTTDYETKGFFGDVIFSNGQLVDKDKITIYYGASDEVICGAEFSINKIFKTLEY